MKKSRIKKKYLYARYLAFIGKNSLIMGDPAWERIAPVGREFGSSDYEELVRIDAVDSQATVSANHLLDSAD